MNGDAPLLGAYGLPLAAAMAGAVLLAGAVPALAAPVTTPIVDRAYDIDLHFGTAIGSPRMVGMGGTTTALSEGAAGALGNPAAAAWRPLGSTGFDWDAALNVFRPDIGHDIDNNGAATAQDVSAALPSGGLLGYAGSWGFGVALSGVSYTLRPPDAQDAVLTIDGALVRFLLARTFADGGLAVGLAARAVIFALARDGEDLFSVTGGGLEGGLVHAPRGQRWRWGLRLSAPAHGTDVESTCDPMNCQGYILPERAIAPWEAAFGFAWRKAARSWNDPVPGRFRDESALVLAADVVASGAVARGSGIEAFAEKKRQASGRGVSVSWRLGAEWEWLPGRLRLRGGSYWEPARFEGVPGRAHLTGGLEWRMFSFTFWDAERRAALSFAGDVARDYGNVGISLGFWH